MGGAVARSGCTPSAELASLTSNVRKQQGSRGRGSNQYHQKEVGFPEETPPTLADLGVNKKQGARGITHGGRGSKLAGSPGTTPQTLADVGVTKQQGARGNPGGRGAKLVGSPRTTPQTLADVGVTKHQVAQWRKLADVPEEAFEAALAAPKSRQPQA